MTIRVLVVYHHLPHYRKGVFKALESADGFEFTFAAGDRARGGIPTIPYESLQRTSRLRNVWFGPFLWQFGLIRLVLSKRFDRIIFLGDVKFVSTWFSLLVARVLGTSTYLWTIGWHRPDHGLKRNIRLAFYRFGRRLLLYGSDGWRMGVAAGFPSDAMTVIGNSSGELPQLRLDREASRNKAVVTVGAVVRLQAVKRLDMLIEAARLLQARGVEVRVMLVGDGPERNNLERQAEESGVEVDFRGAVYDSDALARIYEELDVTVMPEVAGLTVMQSLGHGVPVVTVEDPYQQAPEFRAVVPGVTGGLYPPGDIARLSAEIMVWAERVRDDKRGIAQNCRAEILRKWSPEVNARRILDALVGEP